MESHGITWNHMKSRIMSIRPESMNSGQSGQKRPEGMAQVWRIACLEKGMHGITWNHMKSRGITWNQQKSNGIRGIKWNHVESQGIMWGSIRARHRLQHDCQYIEFVVFLRAGTLPWWFHVTVVTNQASKPWEDTESLLNLRMTPKDYFPLYRFNRLAHT